MLPEPLRLGGEKENVGAFPAAAKPFAAPGLGAQQRQLDGVSGGAAMPAANATLLAGAVQADHAAVKRLAPVVIDLVGAVRIDAVPPTAAAASPTAEVVDLLSDSDAEEASSPDCGAAPRMPPRPGSVIDLCASDSELEPAQQQQQQQQHAARAPQQQQEQEQQHDGQHPQQQAPRRVPMRGHGAAPRPRPPAVPLFSAAVKQEHGPAAAVAVQQEQPATREAAHEHKHALPAAAKEEAAAPRQPPSASTASGSLSVSEVEDGSVLASSEEDSGSELETEAEESSKAEESIGATPGRSGSLEPEVQAQESIEGLQAQESSEGLQAQGAERQEQDAGERSCSEQQPMDWEGSPGADAACGCAPQEAAMLEDAAAAEGDTDSGAAVGAAAECSLPTTEPGSEQLDSLPGTVEVEGVSACSEHGSGSLAAASDPAGGQQPAVAPVAAILELHQEQHQVRPLDPPATAAAAAEGEDAAAAAAVAGTLEALVVACEVHAAAAPQRHSLPQHMPPGRSRLANFSPNLQRLAQRIAMYAKRSDSSANRTSGTAPAAAAAAAAAPAAAVATAAASGGSAQADDDGMPDQSDAGAMLHWLRSRIPAHLLDQYKEPHRVSDEEHAVALERLEVYEREITRVQRAGKTRSKFDLTAASQLPSIYPQWGLWEKTHGHKPGVRLGQRFKGRGWLQALGLHTNYYAGIMFDTGAPAYAICLSGGYEDDDDHGDWLWYTGQGGRDGANGTQGRDQEWTRGNAAIRECMEQGKPLRVCRAVHVEEEVHDASTGQTKVLKKTLYTNDGLYAVVKAQRAVGRGGKALVCRFLLVGIPGHYKANKSVSFVELRGFRDKLRLAGWADESDEERDQEEEEDEAGCSYMDARHKRQKTQAATTADRARKAAAAAATAAPKARKKKAGKQGSGLQAALVPVVQDGAWLAAQQRRPGFLCADISGGVEKYQVPVFNEVDDDPPPQGLTYVRDSIVGSAEAQRLLDLGLSLMPSEWCGLDRGDASGIYLPDGRMKFTRSEGHWECFPGCQRQEQCRFNRFISERGLVLPLEIFRTRGKGWGVRCARDIAGGSYVCSYEGVLLAHKEAESRRNDAYLFDLEHFFLMHRDPSMKGQRRQRLPPLPADVRPGQEDDDDEVLVIDAASTGNLARFINHSCEPNLVLNPVLRPGDSGMRYCVAIFAGRDIPRGTELCYDYGYKVGSVAGKEIPCGCGAKKCKGRLL